MSCSRSVLLYLSGVLLLGGVTGLVPSSAVAQSEGTLRGIVSASDDGRPLQGANVVLRTAEDSLAQAASTDSDGYYQLADLPPGRYRLRVSFVGFSTYRDTLRLDAGVRNRNVTLTPEEQAIGEVEVKAERGGDQQPAGLETVDATDLGRVVTPGPTGDLASYLQTRPGIVSVGDRGGQLYVRGGTPSQNLVLVDGISIVKPFHISSRYSAFPESIVKSADVHAGGFGAEHAGALSSVIDVSLREGNMKQYEASAGGGPFLATTLVEGPIDRGSESFLGVFRHSLVEHTADPLSGKKAPLRFYDLTGRYSLQTDRSSCSVTAMRTFDRGRINPDRNSVLRWTNNAVGSRCLLFGKDLSHAVTVNLAYTGYQNSAGPSGSPERTSSVQKAYASLRKKQDLLGGTFDVGVKWRLSKYGYDLGDKFTALESEDFRLSRIGLHAGFDWRIGDRVKVSPSVATQYGLIRNIPTYEPRLQVAFRPDGTSRQEFSLAVGKYNQLIEGITDERDAGSVFTVWTSVDRSAELPEAWHGILGYQRQIGSVLDVGLEGYVKTLRNIPIPRWTPVARFNTRTTSGQGLVYGADLRAVVETGPLYFFLGYGWSEVNYESETEPLGAWIGGEVFSFSPAHHRRHQVNAVASYELGDFTLNANWALGTGRPFTKLYGYSLALLPVEEPENSPGTAQTLYSRPYGGRLPATHQLDLSLGRTFDLAPGLSLETKIGTINTYNRSNIFYYDLNTLDRINQAPFFPYVSLRALLN